ncbi:elongation factor P maturation arginine rhamnosyltransferase EarP [Rheinheimera sp. MMS21-TC3]|uniref:elongation factor P maturation arginine rhamnosyltransferase EarP n=1 Tax=Rheinheimera sp. MMS21-TC3 TaxID=3072790 RepID=UPI0028C47464|nr:elongation factor P maturation arginine rhamnosyltransferase EarP [Rheinheimera sp. MMS21-TC3]WNO61174.1 elongation factor P maturation arginine rhamnosyltransferase EarP [Rheinheimera sp. MMS21-TC3]
MTIKALKWDIFCAVIDNFGDIGICWRLSRQLASEYNLEVRLWVDDVVSFKRICPQVDTAAQQQLINGVNICLWSEQTQWQQVLIPDVVIEALACTIPQPYQLKMAAETMPPLWLNLEYLSAEAWVEGCHGLASPQPQLAINKYFFFPGFSPATGGLLQEQHLAVQRDAFNNNPQQQAAFWQKLLITEPEQYQYKVSLFAYDHHQLADLLDCWQQNAKPILCVIPEGKLADQVASILPSLNSNQAKHKRCKIGNLSLVILPFLAQDDYDYLLWACDINFVRGEDSIIRAHWANKPFVWQIYRQQEDAHLIKLQSFLQLYCSNMTNSVKEKLQNMYMAWNTQQPLVKVWLDFIDILPEIAGYNINWQQQLNLNGDLAHNLVHFVEKKFIITRNFR